MNIKPQLEFQWGDQWTTVTGVCNVTQKKYSTKFPTKGLKRFLYDGVQPLVALAHSPKEEVEFLVSGISPEGWKQLFGEPAHTEEIKFGG